MLMPLENLAHMVCSGPRRIEGRDQQADQQFNGIVLEAPKGASMRYTLCPFVLELRIFQSENST